MAPTPLPLVKAAAQLQAAGVAPDMKLTLTTDNNQKDFFFSADPAMPAIRITATLTPSPPPPAPGSPPPSFRWTANLLFLGNETPHGKSNAPLVVTATTNQGVLTLDSSKWLKLRGGKLTVTATITIQGRDFTAKLTDLRILGSNPSHDQIAGAVNNDNVMRILHQESGFQQFIGAGWPYFSSDNLGGAGLGQITPASEDERWNWKTNAAKALAKYNSCYTLTNTYVNSMRNSPKVAAAIKKINDARAANKLPALTVTIPDWTADQRIRDAVRGYNGWAGNDPVDPARHLHEYRLAQDADGDLKLTITPNTTNATAIWEVVPASDRPAAGDPDYVNHVMAKDP